jgi:hypothetical protein
VSIPEEGNIRELEYMPGSAIASHCHGEIRPEVVIFAHVWLPLARLIRRQTADSKLVVPNGI